MKLQAKKYIIFQDGKRKEYKVLPHIKKHSKYVSIIITTYNESKNIKKLISAIVKAVPKKYNYEIIVADDNSPDGTSGIVTAYAKKDRHVVCFTRVGYRGVLSAILGAISISRGKYFLTMDADFSHPPETVRDIIDNLEGYDMVVGSRYASGGGIDAPFMHKLATVSLNLALKWTLSPFIPVNDFTGVFHAMNKDKFAKLKLDNQAKWGEFDIEWIYKAYKAGWKIKEVPFVYKYRTEGETKSGGLLKYGTIYFGRALKARFGR